MTYGEAPFALDSHDLVCPELMHYLYLPVKMPGTDVRLERRVQFLEPLISQAILYEEGVEQKFVYLSVVHGFATPGNALNRPGWHCDGFGTEDINYVWWDGPGTRFAVGDFKDIDSGHVDSMRQFEEQIPLVARVYTPPQHVFYRINPYVVHAVPEIEPPGCWRTFVKVSVSTERYNLAGNSHNWLFNYDWKMHDRGAVRNDPIYGEADFYLEEHPRLVRGALANP
jgi:hypothetical protein